MHFVIRADGGPQIGGGHIMRCLTLAAEVARRGHEITFVVGEGPMVDRVRQVGFAVVPLPAAPHTAASIPAHAHWLSAPWEVDAAFTADVITQVAADWLIWDHYGLDARWVDAQRNAKSDLKVLVLDDLDDRELGSDIALDPARVSRGPRAHPVPASLEGPEFALLRPEFAALRPASLARRKVAGPPRRVLIAPGLMDAAGLAPMALRAIAGMDLDAEVVMGGASQSLAEVQSLLAVQDNWRLTLDANDMAQRMLEADFCIGAGGGTSWERCCMGLPSVVVAVAKNQEPGINELAEQGAVLEAKSDSLRMKLEEALERLLQISAQAARLCDGKGTIRVVDALEAKLRPIREDDIQQLYEWRDQPHVRAASLSQAPLNWGNHCAWFAKTIRNQTAYWRIYTEGGRDLGVVRVTPTSDSIWKWSFSIGAANAPRGAGGRMLAMTLASLRQETPTKILQAEVRANNAVSLRLHQRLGFKQIPSDDQDVLVFQRPICDHDTI